MLAALHMTAAGMPRGPSAVTQSGQAVMRARPLVLLRAVQAAGRIFVHEAVAEDVVVVGVMLVLDGVEVENELLEGLRVVE